MKLKEEELMVSAEGKARKIYELVIGGKNEEKRETIVALKAFADYCQTSKKLDENVESAIYLKANEAAQELYESIKAHFKKQVMKHKYTPEEAIQIATVLRVLGITELPPEAPENVRFHLEVPELYK